MIKKFCDECEEELKPDIMIHLTAMCPEVLASENSVDFCSVECLKKYVRLIDFSYSIGGPND